MAVVQEIGANRPKHYQLRAGAAAAASTATSGGWESSARALIRPSARGHPKTHSPDLVAGMYSSQFVLSLQPAGAMGFGLV
jgi:hypothetical protein